MPRPAGLYRSGRPCPPALALPPQSPGESLRSRPPVAPRPLSTSPPGPCSSRLQSPEGRGSRRAGAALPLTLARIFLPHCQGGEPSARVHRPPPPPPALARLAGAEGRCGVTAPCCQRELAQFSPAEQIRRPALPPPPCGSALRRARGRAAPLQIPPRPQCTRALALTSPERHMSSLGLRNVPLQRRSGRGRQTLTKCALGPAQQRGRAQGPRRLGLVWDRP